ALIRDAAQDLQGPAGVADQPRLDQRFGRDIPALGEIRVPGDITDVHDPELLAELGVGEPELGDPAEEGHLAALELETGGGAGSRAGALLAATRGLAPRPVLAAPDALARLVLAGSGGDVVDHHDQVL